MIYLVNNYTKKKKKKVENKMINKLEKIIQELEFKVAEEYFINEIIYERNEKDTECIRIERVPYGIDDSDNFITELERDLELDWNIRLELDTRDKMIVIKQYSKLW